MNEALVVDHKGQSNMGRDTLKESINKRKRSFLNLFFFVLSIQVCFCVADFSHARIKTEENTSLGKRATVISSFASTLSSQSEQQGSSRVLFFSGLEKNLKSQTSLSMYPVYLGYSEGNHLIRQSGQIPNVWR